MIRMIPDDFVEAEWFVRCLVLHGAHSVKVDVDDKRVTGIHFQFPGGRERFVDYSNHPSRPCLIVGRGRA